MFTSFYIQVSNTFTIIGGIAESRLKLINNTRSKVSGNPIFEIEVITKSGLIFKHYLHFTTTYNSNLQQFTTAIYNNLQQLIDRW